MSLTYENAPNRWSVLTLGIAVVFEKNPTKEIQSESLPNAQFTEATKCGHNPIPKSHCWKSHNNRKQAYRQYCDKKRCNVTPNGIFHNLFACHVKTILNSVFHAVLITIILLFICHVSPPLLFSSRE